jgi:hypothetical protein
MEFIETPTFTKVVSVLLADDLYAKLQMTLALRPDLGKVIKGSGGIRKVRWGTGSRGKRGGVRVIYYWHMPDEQIWMLLMYGKNEKDDLSPEELKKLRRLVQDFLA